jgi:hypothetical protein
MSDGYFPAKWAARNESSTEEGRFEKTFPKLSDAGRVTLSKYLMSLNNAFLNERNCSHRV